MWLNAFRTKSPTKDGGDLIFLIICFAKELLVQLSTSLDSGELSSRPQY